MEERNGEEFDNMMNWQTGEHCWSLPDGSLIESASAINETLFFLQEHYVTVFLRKFYVA